MSIGSSPFQGGGSASIADATESTAGKIRIATTSESTTGTNDTAAMTPAKVKARIDAALVGGVEYKGTFNATTGLTNSGGNLNNAEQGDLYVIDTAGTIYGATWAVGDHLLINADMGGSISNSKIDKVDNTESDTLDTVTGRGATTSNAVQVGGLNIAGSYALPTSDGSAGQILKTDGSGALTFQSLGSISTQAANNVNITGGAISGITDLAIADGGTGASTEAQARTNLGLAIGSDVQAHDAGLTSISGLTTAADKMLYTTGSDTYAVTSLTAAGRALLDDADAAAQRTTLGLAAVAASGAYSDLSGAPTVPTTLNTLTDVSISSVSNGQVISYNSTSGEWENSTPASGGASDLNGLSDVTITGAAAGNVLERNGAGQFINVAKSTIDVGDFNDDNTYQPKDAGLTSISGLTTAADKMIYTTGSDTYAVTGLTSAGRALLDDADAAAQRTTLGLGTAATSASTDFQAVDAGLTSISGLTTAADKMIYTTGSDTYAVTGLTSAGRALLDDADAAAQRTTLGLGTAATSASTDFQAVDAGLTSISGLTTAADKMIYTTGSDTYAVTSLTAAGRALLDDADAAAQRTTLGLVIGTDVLSDVVQDTSPQLGGNLDLNGQDIVTTSNANLELAPDGTGVVSIKGNTTGGSNQGALKLNCEQNSHFVQIKSPSHSLLSSGGSYTLTLPPDDGDANQVLKTDGSGVLDWVDQASGGGTIPDVVVTGNAGNVSAAFASAGSNGENERVYLINNSSTARTVTLPATSGNSGKKLQVKRLGTANVTIAVQSGETLETTTDGTFILSAQFSSVTLVCNASGTLDGWYII